MRTGGCSHKRPAVFHPFDACGYLVVWLRWQVLPPRDDIRATCVAATEDFCVYGTSSGSIEFFYFGEWTLLAGVELRHEEPIRAIYPNAKGAHNVAVLFVVVQLPCVL